MVVFSAIGKLFIHSYIFMIICYWGSVSTDKKSIVMLVQDFIYTYTNPYQYVYDKPLSYISRLPHVNIDMISKICKFIFYKMFQCYIYIYIYLRSCITQRAYTRRSNLEPMTYYISVIAVISQLFASL